jgi:type I site-specific restriction endonuclease
MTTSISSRVVIAFSAIALAMSVATAAAQTGKSTDLLTSKQVKDLVAAAQTPADHVKLQKHFLAVAAKYDAEAAEHADLAQSYRKPPVGRLMPGSYPKKAEHCDRLTQTLRDAAKEARELAAEHGQMATAK